MDRLSVNAVIFGAGAAGLWILDELRRRGFSALLFEATGLGDGQTISSQGIIHSGLKYSLAGLLTAAAREARDTVDIWKQCFAGVGRPDLSDTKILSPSFFLWGTDSAASRIGMLGARIGLRSTPQNVPLAERPTMLQRCSGAVYRVDEEVLSPASLLNNLAAPHRASLFRYDAAAGVEFDRTRTGELREVRFTSPDDGTQIAVSADWFIFAAGDGNEGLRARAGIEASKMQRRPLHVCLVRGPLPEFYGHCIEGAKTRVTITSAVDAAGRTVWQVAGNLAEDCVDLDTAGLIRKAQSELAATLPDLDLRGTEWTTYRVDRAEGATLTGGRPDSFKLFQDGNILSVWPTKLVLVPRLATEVASFVARSAPREVVLPAACASWPKPEVAPPHWDRPHDWKPFGSV